MALRTIPPQGMPRICRIDSGPLARLPLGPLSTELPTCPIPAPPPPTYPLFAALCNGCKTGKPFTIATTEHDAWLTYDPIARWVTGSCVGSVDFWRGKARALDACCEGPQRMVIGAMLRYDPALEHAQWTVSAS